MTAVILMLQFRNCITFSYIGWPWESADMHQHRKGHFCPKMWDWKGYFCSLWEYFIEKALKGKLGQKCLCVRAVERNWIKKHIFLSLPFHDLLEGYSTTIKVQTVMRQHQDLPKPNLGFFKGDWSTNSV